MKNINTEYSSDEEKNDKKFLYKGIQTTDLNHYKSQSTTLDIFLDYAFRQKKNIINKDKQINKQKLTNYCYELEQTVSLNLDILLSFISNSKLNNKKIIITNDNKSRDTAASSSFTSTSSLIQLIKIIKEKTKKKAEINKNINNLVAKINDRIDENKKYYQDIKEQKFKFKQKLHKTNQNLDDKDNYIIVLNRKFYKIQKYLDNILLNKKNKILNSNKNIYDFLSMNIYYCKKRFNLKKLLKKYYCDVSELKIDNDLYLEEKKLYKDKNNIDLIRCMEFYRRVNTTIYTNLRILRKKHQKVIDIMEFLNLGNIVQFIKVKNEEEPNYEIEFSKINKEENSFDILSKMNRNINFSISLDN